MSDDAVPVVEILLGLTTLADLANGILIRYAKGNMTDVELAEEWRALNNRVMRAERILAKALAIRRERAADVAAETADSL